MRPPALWRARKTAGDAPGRPVHGVPADHAEIDDWAEAGLQLLSTPPSWTRRTFPTSSIRTATQTIRAIRRTTAKASIGTRGRSLRGAPQTFSMCSIFASGAPGDRFALQLHHRLPSLARAECSHDKCTVSDRHGRRLPRVRRTGRPADDGSFQYGLDPKYSGGGAVVYTNSTPGQTVGSDFSSHAVSARCRVSCRTRSTTSGSSPRTPLERRSDLTSRSPPPRRRRPAPRRSARLQRLARQRGRAGQDPRRVRSADRAHADPEEHGHQRAPRHLSLTTAARAALTRPTTPPRKPRSPSRSQDAEGHVQRRGLQAQPGDPRRRQGPRHAHARRGRVVQGRADVRAPARRPRRQTTPPPPRSRAGSSSCSTRAPRASSDQRPLQRRHRPRHEMDDRRPLRRHPHPRHHRLRGGHRLRPPQDDHPPRRPELPRQSTKVEMRIPDAQYHRSPDVPADHRDRVAAAFALAPALARAQVPARWRSSPARTTASSRRRPNPRMHDYGRRPERDWQSSRLWTSLSARTATTCTRSASTMTRSPSSRATPTAGELSPPIRLHRGPRQRERPARTLRRHRARRPPAIAISPDGQNVYVAAEDNERDRRRSRSSRATPNGELTQLSSERLHRREQERERRRGVGLR